MPVGGLQRVLELLAGHEKVRSRVVNCKPNRLVMVEYAPMHLKGFHARVPALVVAVVFYSPSREFDRILHAKRTFHAPLNLIN